MDSGRTPSKSPIRRPSAAPKERSRLGHRRNASLAPLLLTPPAQGEPTPVSGSSQRPKAAGAVRKTSEQVGMKTTRQLLELPLKSVGLLLPPLASSSSMGNLSGQAGLGGTAALPLPQSMSFEAKRYLEETDEQRWARTRKPGNLQLKGMARHQAIYQELMGRSKSETRDKLYDVAQPARRSFSSVFCLPKEAPGSSIPTRKESRPHPILQEAYGLDGEQLRLTVPDSYLKALRAYEQHQDSMGLARKWNEESRRTRQEWLKRTQVEEPKQKFLGWAVRK